ncbi:hypothetical protein PGT21_000744, partial [Puccinia graminis f. sp. tritici]
RLQINETCESPDPRRLQGSSNSWFFLLLSFMTLAGTNYKQFIQNPIYNVRFGVIRFIVQTSDGRSLRGQRLISRFLLFLPIQLADLPTAFGPPPGFVFIASDPSAWIFWTSDPCLNRGIPGGVTRRLSALFMFLLTLADCKGHPPWSSLLVFLNLGNLLVDTPAKDNAGGNKDTESSGLSSLSDENPRANLVKLLLKTPAPSVTPGLAPPNTPMDLG